MIVLNNITLYRGTKLLFQDVNFNILPKKRIGVVGVNGSGKSSLFSLILQELTSETGNITYQSSIKIGHLSQVMPNSTCSALEYTISGNEQIYSLFESLKQAEKDENSILVGQIHAKLFDMNAYSIKRIKSEY